MSTTIFRKFWRMKFSETLENIHGDTGKLTRRHLKTCRETLENIQKRAMSILFLGINYPEALKIAKLPSLSIRRDLLCKTFFMQVSKPESKLNYLIEKRNEHSYDLRHNQIYKIEIPRTERYIKKVS